MATKKATPKPAAVTAEPKVENVIGLDSNNKPFTAEDLDNATLTQIAEPVEVEEINQDGVQEEDISLLLQSKTETAVEDAEKDESEDTPKSDEPAEEPFIKSGFRKVRANEFRGSYKDAQFDDNCICHRISEATIESLKTDFPGIQLEEIE